MKMTHLLENDVSWQRIVYVGVCVSINKDFIRSWQSKDFITIMKSKLYIVLVLLIVEGKFLGYVITQTIYYLVKSYMVYLKNENKKRTNKQAKKQKINWQKTNKLPLPTRRFKVDYMYNRLFVLCLFRSKRWAWEAVWMFWSL